MRPLWSVAPPDVIPRRECVSHTVWRQRADLEAWRNSDQFRAAHAGATVQGVIARPPHVSLYEAVIAGRNEAVVTPAS
jgi:heme-degrading monooxygenase HmoA